MKTCDDVFSAIGPISVLTELFQDKQWKVRYAAAKALERIGEQKGSELFLANQARDKDIGRP